MQIKQVNRIRIPNKSKDATALKTFFILTDGGHGQARLANTNMGCFFAVTEHPFPPFPTVKKCFNVIEACFFHHFMKR